MAASLPPGLQNELNDVFTALEGLERTRYASFAALCCLVYDMMLTFDDEVRYFWTGPWTISRVLFFVNRYFPFSALGLGLVGVLTPNMSAVLRRSTSLMESCLMPLLKWPFHRCTHIIHAAFLLTIIGIGVIQAIIVLRICYVYSRNQTLRLLIVGSFLSTIVSTLVLFATIWHDVDAVAADIPGYAFHGCNAPPSRQVWRLYVPNLILHTILYLATTVPALRSHEVGKQSQVMRRLARDGGLFYFVVFATATFACIGSLARTTLVTIPAVYSGLLLGLCSMAVSRLMLSIRSLAAQLSLSPDWLLNNTELGRVNWRPGPRNGELIVEVEACEEDLELTSVEDESPTKRSRTPVIHTTRVGVLEHPSYPGTRDYKAPPRLPKKQRPKLVLPPAPKYEPKPLHHDPLMNRSFLP